MDKIIIFFKFCGIYNEDFFIFISNRIKWLPSDSSLEWFGCFPIINNGGVLVDIRILIPKVTNEQNMLVCLHEIYHAYELYSLLGNIYVDDTDNYELRAKAFEKSYLDYKKV